MACCAFGLFLLSQILLPFRRVRTLLFGPELELGSPGAPNASVAWSLGDGPAAAAAAAPASPRLARRMIVGLVATEVLMFAAGGWAVVTHGPHWIAEAHAAVFGPDPADVLCRVDPAGDPLAQAPPLPAD
ncbi:hypothetical protein [Zavarzinia sp. CC-PAN008]|uniref:hypothetical protein n=1 Tax=Zavarzinia sp. CC-PAN008 TaxID=3243332 RepID=UPI003F74803E